LQVSQSLLQGETSELHEQLEEEQTRSDELEKALEDALAQLDEQKSIGEAAQNQIRMQTREAANLKVGTCATRQHCSTNPDRLR
jgi:chromosome segregation ATPase